MEGKGLAEVVHLAKEDEEEAITELLRRLDPFHEKNNGDECS